MNIFGQFERRERYEDRFITDAIRTRLLLRGIEPYNLKPRRFELQSLFARIVSIFKGTG